jgi:RNA polymerase sigma factor (TIGR02999 family)
MRRILVENARAKDTLKRGGRGGRVELDDAVTRDVPRPDDVLAVDDALDRLAAIDPQAAQLVKLRFYAGMTGDQAAAALGVSPRTADSLWAYARAWLYDHLGG